jgi:organic hydroperoxide reductase OsmC/OhrA
MSTQHHYKTTITWTGNTGTGTDGYQQYERSHTVEVEGKPILYGSSDKAFRGDRSKYNPEDLLLASLSACHMLWYLHLCAEEGVVVVAYADRATGVMAEIKNGGGKFTEATLNPLVLVKEPSMVEKAKQLHTKANELCFIASSVNFPVRHRPEIQVE